MFHKRNGYILAKLEVILHKILSVNDRKQVCDIYDKYTKYQKNIFTQLQDFSIDNFEKKDIEILKSILDRQSLFYSYCFDHYNLLPSLLLSLSNEVIVVVSDSLLAKLGSFFTEEARRLSSKMNSEVKIQFITNTEPNLLFKLKKAVTNGSKILIFVDGNKGNSKEKEENLLLTNLKGHKIFFHQGFGLLSYILRNDILTGVLVRKNQQKIYLDIITDKIDIGLGLKEYRTQASELLVKHLNDTIDLDHVHLWNNLLTVHEWFIIDEETTGTKYATCKIGENEYCAIEYDTFKVYIINREEYLSLK